MRLSRGGSQLLEQSFGESWLQHSFRVYNGQRAERTRTFDKEQVCASILFLRPRKVSNDPIHVLRRRHQYVEGLEFGLPLAMVCNGFNDCNARERISGWASFPPAAKRVVRVTFSSRISNCLRTAPRSFCENSSTTRIFHRPGGLTERIASRNSTAQAQETTTLQVNRTYYSAQWLLAKAKTC